MMNETECEIERLRELLDLWLDYAQWDMYEGSTEKPRPNLAQLMEDTITALNPYEP